jgi:endonuclease/exonuclease/phosphatase family metal-dependent hydrolase
LKSWLLSDAQKVDSDVIILGDWNEPPDSSTWSALHEMERKGQILFQEMNHKDDISHLMYKNKNEIGTRLDLSAVTISSANQLVNRQSQVVRWKSLDNLLKGNPKASQIKEYIQEVSKGVSDHMPVVTRFYFEKK